MFLFFFIGIRIQPSADSNIHDIFINVSNSEDDRGNKRGLISLGKKYYSNFSKYILLYHKSTTVFF